MCVKRGRKLACPPGCHVSNTADLRWSLCISRLLQNGRNVRWLYPIKLKIGYQMWDHCERCNHIFSCQAPLFLMITEKMNLTPSISHSSNKVTRQGEKKKKKEVVSAAWWSACIIHTDVLEWLCLSRFWLQAVDFLYDWPWTVTQLGKHFVGSFASVFPSMIRSTLRGIPSVSTGRIGRTHRVQICR